MLQSRAGRVRLLIDDQLIELARPDVESVQTLPPPDGLRPGAAVHVRLWLRPGARLLTAVGTQGLAERLFTPQRPFAVAVRGAELTLAPSGEYARLETEYLTTHGLDGPT